MKIALAKMTTDNLVQSFVLLSIKQDDALLEFAPSREINALYHRISAIAKELKSRPGDERRVLIGLLAHPNPQVRIKAALATLAIAPEQARAVLEELRLMNGPQRVEAGMTLAFLDDGTFRPT